jgi:hypothetical protein
MIEPQNTVMPIAAPSSPVDAPHGDVTFGEMLAQSLGVIPQLDFRAIAAISGDQPGGEQSGDVGTDVDSEQTDKQLDDGKGRGGQAFVGIVPTRQFSIVRPGGDGPIASDPVIVDEPVAPVTPAQPGTPVLGPSRGEQEPTLPVVGPEASDQGEVADEPGATGGATDAVPAPIPVPDDTAPAVAPSLDPEETQVPVAAHAPTDAPAQAPEENPEETVLPEPVRDDSAPPGSGDGDVFENMPRIRGPEPSRHEGTLPFDQAPVEAVVRLDSPSKPSPSIPTLPTPPRSDQIPTSRVEPTTAPAVSVEDAAVVLGEAVPVRITDSKVRIEPATSNGTEIVPSLSPEGAARSTTAAVSAFAVPAASAQHTALAERVLEAVQLQANQPPPRTMIVDIPEIEGLRLVVSVRGGAEVHVVPTSGSTVSSGLQPFMNDLENVLAHRGFTMTGDGRRRGGKEHQPEEDEMPRRSRPTFNRPTDNELRI